MVCADDACRYDGSRWRIAEPAERVRELWAWRPGWYHPQDDERHPHK